MMQGIASVVDVMDAYSLTKADYDAITDLTKFKSKAGWAADPTKELTAVVKSAFTREVNKSASSRRARSSFMLPETAVGKKRGRKAAMAAAAAPATGRVAIAMLLFVRPNAPSESVSPPSRCPPRAAAQSVGAAPAP